MLFLTVAFVVLAIGIVLQIITLVWVKRTENRVADINESNTPSGLLKLFKAIVGEQLEEIKDETICSKPKVVILDLKGDLKKSKNAMMDERVQKTLEKDSKKVKKPVKRPD